MLSRRCVADERGWVLVIAVVVMALMLSLGLGAYAYVDQQSRESGQERTREAAFNLAEGALTAQLYMLSRNWPGEDTRRYPAGCTPSSNNPGFCPTSSKLAARFTQIDYTGTGSEAMTWSTLVVDNATQAENGVGDISEFYDETVGLAEANANPPLTWDADGDGTVWVRAIGTARGKTRKIVAQVRIEQAPVSFPNNVLTAGRIHVITSGVGNSNNQSLCQGVTPPPIVCTAAPGTIEATDINVRCVSPTYSSLTKSADDFTSTGNHCLGWNSGQVAPIREDGVHCGGGNPVEDGCLPWEGGEAISSEGLDALRDKANSTSTYCGVDGTNNPTFCNTGNAAAGCPKIGALTSLPVPDDPDDPGITVFIEKTPTNGCSYSTNAAQTVFTASHPGQIIIAGGPSSPCSGSAPNAFEISGSFTIQGIVYSANLQGWSNQPAACPTLPDPANVSVKGNARIVGAVALEADGLLELNANANNVLYNPLAIDTFTAYGTAGIIQNTWRELK